MKFILSLVFCLSTLNSLSQSQEIFEKINKSNGLSSSRITSIVKAENGFVWIGSENGLNRYDGKELKVYNRQNSSISSNNINDVLIDSKGRIWIATLGGGLNLYNPLNDEFLIYKNRPGDIKSLPSNQLNVLFEDSDENLWIGSENGLCVFNEDDKSFITYKNKINDPNSIQHNSVTCIYEGSEGNFWIGTFGGGLNMFRKETEKFENIESDVTLFTDFIHAIIKLDDSSLLIGTSGSGLLLFNLESQTFSVFFDELSPFRKEVKIVRSFYKDNKGNIWVGTDGQGLIKIPYKDKFRLKVQNYDYNQQVESSLSGNAIYEIMEDDESNIWIGTAWNGINILKPKMDYEFLFSDIDGEHPAPVLSIYKNKDYLFFGLDGKGLTAFNLENRDVNLFSASLNNSVGGEYVQSITESKTSSYWLGTFANGLINFDLTNNRYVQYKHDSNNVESISFNDIRCVVEDEARNLWVASWGGGLNYFNSNTKRFRSFRENKNDPNSISSDNIIYIVKDKEWLWLATFGGGLEYFNTKTKELIHYKYDENDPNTISSDNVLSLLKDSKGNLWIGTSGGGINLLDIKNKKINRFESTDEVRYQTVTGIVEDDEQNIWFSTKKGVFKYDYNLQEFVNFPFLDNEYHINSVFKDENGMLYFGTTSGVLRFDPKMIFKKNIQPEVAITNFKLFNKELEVDEKGVLTKNIIYTDSLTLKHDLNVITFEFAALQFPFSSKCEYAIQMEGFDKNWRNIGHDRTVTYTNLSHGSYNFKVKSREVGSIWGDTYTSMNIEVLKPFWLEWWAIILYVFVILLALYLFRKYTIAWEQLKTNLKLEKFTHEKDIELYNLKQQFFTNVSHDIRTPVTLILGAINGLLQGKEIIQDEQLNPINTIKKNGNKLVNLVNELLDHRKLEFNKVKLYLSNQNLIEFCEEIYLSFKELALQRGIDFIFKTNSKEVEVWFDKNQLEKVLYNLLSNAFKFTGAFSIVEFFVFEKEDIIEIQIKDRGVGIAKSQLTKIFNRFYQTKNDGKNSNDGFGLGLSISKEIIELHHGEISVDSVKGEGTIFNIKLKKGREHFTDDQIFHGKNSNELLENYFVNWDTEESAIATVTKNSINKEQNQTLLIVEDNKDIRDYIAKLLINEFDILEASQGEEALKLVLSNPPDLIISDVMMPIMDGISLTKQLKSNLRTSHIPILLLTARASFNHKVEGFEIGADDYITKPFNELLLKSRIKNILKNRELLHEKFWKKELIPISELKLNKSDEEFMSKLIRILEENMNSTDLKVNFVCSELGMSHSVVYKKIKSLTNMTYVEFVRDFKLKTAKKLIAEQNFTVLDASYHVGYSDRKYFSKLFKQRFGKVPSDYIVKK
ncbi:response regulator [Seonamhaeicola sp. MEBiC1930]|uniref:hybrid sensor histidine kinase/response regulator transcription factor n=1 Tax=Seonamhaeicola sp. MEBiC01930 TaxID=2976768 RepID=UPI003248BC44